LNDVLEDSSHDIFQFFRYHSLGHFTKVNVPGLYLGYQFSDEITPLLDTIWERYYNAGYVTAVVDDSCLDWSGRYQGKTSKVDHQFVAPFCLDESHPIGIKHSNFRGPFSIFRRCMSGRYVHSYALDYLAQFWNNYAGYPRFSVTMFNEGHEGTGEVIATMDDDLSDFLGQGFKTGVSLKCITG
jgi:hypothetical protein